ncbi:MAG: hypothetical protein PHV82_03125 [Victivallaceae bacterium]|nr:hypothetical protein [Victivallaceae bacterium]
MKTIDKAYHGKSRSNRQKKYYSVANAAECVGELSHGCEKFGLTQGQFSFFDILETILNVSGPANVVIATWTAAGAETARAKEFLKNGAISSIKWIVDRSFASRQPEYCQILVDNFGDCIRTIRTHAKFLLIYNDEWNFVIRTSMNLNSNPRIENFEISEDKDFCNYLLKFVDEVFEKHSMSDNFNNSAEICRFPGFDDHEAITSAKPAAENQSSYTFNMLDIKQKTAMEDLEIKRLKKENEYIKLQKLKKTLLPINDVIKQLETLKQYLCNDCLEIIQKIINNINLSN